LSREERRTLINFRLDPFPFPFEERGETVFLDISALNKDSALFLLVDSKFFHNELRKIGSRLVLKNVRGTPRLYVRSISWARRDTWLADLVAARKYKHWHAAFFRCVRLANEEPPLLDYRTANASVSWLSADARSNDIDKLSSKDGRNDPAMEIGNRYAAQFIQEEPFRGSKTSRDGYQHPRQPTAHCEHFNDRRSSTSAKNATRYRRSFRSKTQKSYRAVSRTPSRLHAIIGGLFAF
jgi:hypothetical protein